jgi:hypothetical protein
MMTNSTTTITTANDIGAALDELAYALAEVPGRLPNDAQRAKVLLSLTVTLINGNAPSGFLLDSSGAMALTPATHRRQDSGSS